MMNPRDVVPESNMPGFPWLADNKLDPQLTTTKMRALKAIGVPYTDADFASVGAAVEGRTEMDALIEYLQALKYNGGTAAKGQP